ncbi:MAG: AAA family ATPase [Rhizobiales bacterium]|nr:AAA family ATPase [Hyphomicrobiales bacterium]
MLARLSIRDIVLIDRLDIDFAPGLAVLTGETGAGKSILLDAFALALGARGDATLVRHGADQGQVTALFELSPRHPARVLAAESGVAPDEALILRRVQFADGRTRAFVNDQPVGVQTLQALGAALVEIHGQHDARALVDAGTHRGLLDAYGRLEDEAVEVGRLWVARRKAAEKLDKAVNAELKPLKLERAKFSTQIESDAEAAGPNGIDRVEFWVQTNPGTRPGPLMKVASGGELARFLLALKVVLADRGSAPTLVFDEIDTGVGGAVADAIGVRLARLGGRVQVVTVTHAPQVAARAGRHYLITKDTMDKGKRVATRVTELPDAKRREEIARMLAGAEITAEARAAADKLIRSAAG